MSAPFKVGDIVRVPTWAIDEGVTVLDARMEDGKQQLLLEYRAWKGGSIIALWVWADGYEKAEMGPLIEARKE